MTDAGASLSAAVATKVDEQQLFDGVRTLVVGCSGGGDSVALACLLAAREGREGAGPRLMLAHVEHGVRGDEGARDRARVEALAVHLDLPLRVRALAPLPNPSETHLRRARLRELARVVEEEGADAVALGHTADDVAETLLLNAARGAGIGGLGALRARRRLGELLILRPLLGVRRQVLREWLREHSVTWEEDSTNQDLRVARNRIRHRVLPELEAAVPGAVEAAVRLADLAGCDEDWWGERVAETFDDLARPDAHPGSRALDAEGLDRLHPALRSRLLREAVRRVRGDLRGIGRNHSHLMDELMKGRHAAVDLPGVRVRRENGLMRFLPLENRRLTALHSHSGRPSEC